MSLKQGTEEGRRGETKEGKEREAFSEGNERGRRMREGKTGVFSEGRKGKRNEGGEKRGREGRKGKR